MTTGIIIIVILLVLAVSFWRPLGRVRTAMGLAHLLSTGHAFLILGYLLGLAGGGHDAAPAEGELGIAPIIALVAGWVGFATGMRFELRVLRTVPGRAFGVAMAPALAAAAVVGPAGYGVLTLLFGVERTSALGAATVLAAAAASSGPTLAAILRTRRPGRWAQTRASLRMVEFSAGIDDVVVVALAVLGFALFRPVAEPLAPVGQIAVAGGGGALLGVVAWLFLGAQASEDEGLLLGLAMLAFTAGFASWLLSSPAAVTAIAAVVLCNLPGGRGARLFQAVRRVERPAVVILMTAIGFRIAGPLSWVVVPLVLVMTLLRLVAKHATGQLVTGPIPRAPGLAASSGWALGLVPQGMLGLMVALSFLAVWRDEIARSVLAAVAIASLINELWAPLLLARALRDEHVQAARAERAARVERALRAGRSSRPRRGGRDQRPARGQRPEAEP
jgi:hypothetical protein